MTFRTASLLLASILAFLPGCPGPSGDSDTGVDSGRTDTGTPVDGGGSDTAVPDDVRPVDTGTVDTGAVDTGVVGDDAGGTDAGGDQDSGVDVDGGGMDVRCGARLGPCAGRNSFCDFARDGCDYADATGVCRPRPDFCTDIFDPVCGCDGVTYSNECDAHAAGVDAASRGACGGRP